MARVVECRECGAKIFWGTFEKSGKSVPLDEEEVPMSDWGDGEKLYGFDDESGYVKYLGTDFDMGDVETRSVHTCHWDRCK